MEQRSVLIATIMETGWPWRRPKSNTISLTDARGGCWKREGKVRWDWWSWRWVHSFTRVEDSESSLRAAPQKASWVTTEPDSVLTGPAASAGTDNGAA